MAKAKLVWDAEGMRTYETGVKQAVLFPKTGVSGAYADGVAWNGLTKVTESPSGAEPSPLWANDQKYLELMSSEQFGCTIEAYTYPEEFEQCNGAKSLAPGVTIGQQPRKPFGLCYKTTIGNDTDGIEHGYKLHLVYGCLAKPSSRDYSTINETPEAVTMSWEISTTPVPVKNNKPSAHLDIDSTKVDAAKLAALEVILYGKDGTTEPVVEGVAPRLPLPDEVATLVAAG